MEEAFIYIYDLIISSDCEIKLVGMEDVFHRFLSKLYLIFMIY